MKKYISVLLCAAIITASAGCASEDVRSEGNAPEQGGAPIGQTTSSEEVTSSDTVSTVVSQTSSAYIPEETEPAETTTQTTAAPEETTVQSTTTAPEENAVEQTSSAQTTAQTTAAVPQEETEEETVEDDDFEEDYVEYILDESEVIMTLPDTVFTTDTERFTVELEYIGEEGEHYYGAEYSLKKWSDSEGDWVDFPLGENSGFNALAYELGQFSRTNTFTVSLSDDFYAQPVTAGTYLLVKPICDDVVLEQTFEVKAAEGDMIIESESGTLTLEITEIHEDKLSCQLPWPYPAVYEVVCNPSEYGELCVGDIIEVQFAPLYKVEEFRYKVQPVSISMSDFELQEDVAYKPVIYLYPEEETTVSVQLDYNGTLTVTEPLYDNGWQVVAYPDGRLVAADGSEYPYLFWEGENDFALSMDGGFCVSGGDTEQFLREKLAYLGLNDSETADFLEFWLPHMQGSPYNIIRFHGEDYTDNAVMEISSLPDTVIRVYMTVERTAEPVDIAEQQLTPAPERSGFTVVEWGGGIVAGMQ